MTAHSKVAVHRRLIRRRCGAAAFTAVVACSLVALVALVVPASLAQPARAERHMVVAANPHAAEAGLEILRAGGSAVDAAIAVQLVLSLVEPQSSGIGGGAFLLHFDADARVADNANGANGADRDGARAAITAYEGRETAPAAATPDMFLGANGRPLGFGAASAGGLPVGVPGVLRMLELAHRDHGRLPWADLFAPAIRLAEQGFEVSPRLHALLDGFGRFASAPEFRAHYYDEAGNALPVGHKLVNAEYAATLRTLAAGGADEFYTGELAVQIVERVRDNPVGAGRLTLEDMRDYRAHAGPPVCTIYRRNTVCGPQLPSSGGVTTQQILGMLDTVELPDIATEPVAAIHWVAEATRLAFADRNYYLGDPDFVDVPAAALLDERYLARRAALISPSRALADVAPGDPLPAVAWNYAASPPQRMKSTSHLSVVDSFGDAVSMTTSVQSSFGSQLMVGGFLLNNQLTDFEYTPTQGGLPVANRVEGGKRPLSSMSPTLVLGEDGRLRLVIGSPGGTRIIAFVAQAVIGVLDWGLDVQEAVSAPHFLATDGPLELEQGTGIVEHRAALEALGHTVAARGINSGLHGIAIERAPDGSVVLEGGVDPRREGVALGD